METLEAPIQEEQPVKEEERAVEGEYEIKMRKIDVAMSVLADDLGYTYEELRDAAEKGLNELAKYVVHPKSKLEREKVIERAEKLKKVIDFLEEKRRGAGEEFNKTMGKMEEKI